MARLDAIWSAASGSLQTDATDSLSYGPCHVDFPVNPTAPRRTVSDLTQENLSTVNLLSDHRTAVVAVLAVNSRAHARIVEIDFDVLVMKHQPEAANLRQMLGMDAEEHSPLSGMAAGPAVGCGQKLRE